MNQQKRSAACEAGYSITEPVHRTAPQLTSASTAPWPGLFLKSNVTRIAAARYGVAYGRAQAFTACARELELHCVRGARRSRRSRPLCAVDQSSSTTASLGDLVAPVLACPMISRAIWVRRLSAPSSSASDLASNSATSGRPI